MDLLIKKMEIEEEISRKAYVHWKPWQRAFCQVPFYIYGRFFEN